MGFLRNIRNMSDKRVESIQRELPRRTNENQNGISDKNSTKNLLVLVKNGIPFYRGILVCDGGWVGNLRRSGAVFFNGFEKSGILTDFQKYQYFFTQSAPQAKILTVSHHCLQISLCFFIYFEAIVPNFQNFPEISRFFWNSRQKSGIFQKKTEKTLIRG